MTFGKKAKEEAPVPQASVAPIPSAPARPARALLEKRHAARVLKQAELSNAQSACIRIEAELSKMRADEMWLEDHPEADGIFERFLADEDKSALSALVGGTHIGKI